MAMRSKKDCLTYKQIGFTDEEWEALTAPTKGSEYVTKGKMIRDIVLLVCLGRYPKPRNSEFLLRIMRGAPDISEVISKLEDGRRAAYIAKMDVTNEKAVEIFGAFPAKFSPGPTQNLFSASSNREVSEEIKRMGFSEKLDKVRQISATRCGDGAVQAAKFVLDRELHRAGFDPTCNKFVFDSRGRLSIEHPGGRCEIIGDKFDPIKSAIDKFFASV